MLHSVLKSLSANQLSQLLVQRGLARRTLGLLIFDDLALLVLFGLLLFSFSLFVSLSNLLEGFLYDCFSFSKLPGIVKLCVLWEHE